jgi:hypothetical protein
MTAAFIFSFNEICVESKWLFFSSKDDLTNWNQLLPCWRNEKRQPSWVSTLCRFVDETMFVYDDSVEGRFNWGQKQKTSDEF